MKPKPTFSNLFAITSAASIAMSPTALPAVAATWVGASGSGQNWQTATNWSTNPGIPASAGDTATFANTLSSNTTILLNGAVTLGSLVNLDTNNEINLQNGTGGSITFDTGTAVVPTIDVSARTSGVGLLLYATINGSNGLGITGSTTTQIRLNSANTDWAGFSGGLAVTQGILSPQNGNYSSTTNAVTANKVLPTDERLTLGATGTTNFNLSSGRDIAVGSLAGNSNAYVYNSSTGASFAVLAVGNDNTNGAVFGGTIGNDSGNSAGSNILHLHKIGSGTQEISGKITGPGNVVVVNGTLNLSNSANNNDYTGTTTVNSGATLKIGSANALGSTAGTTTINSGGTLDFNGTTISEVLSVTGTGVGGNGALVNSNTSSAGTLNSEITNGANFTVGGAGDITLQRARSGGAVFTLTKTGAGALTLGNANTTSHMNLLAVDVESASTVNFNTVSGTNYLVADRGVKVAAGGTVKYTGTGNNMVGDNQEVIVSNGTFDMNGISDSVGRLTIGDSTNNGLISGGSGSTLTVGGSYQAFAAGGTTLSGGIEAMSGTVNVRLAGAAALTKTTGGTVTLSQANTYTGTTSISAGTLVVNGDQSAATGAVTVGAGGTNATAVRLSGTGIVGGNTSFTADPNATGTDVGGIHSVGDSSVNGGVGKQTFDQTGAATTDLTYNSGSIFEWQLGATTKDSNTGGALRGTDWDAVNVTGALSGTNAIFRIVLNGTQTFADSFWNADHQWADIFKTGDAGSNVSFASVFGGGFEYYNASASPISNTNGSGRTFTITGSTLNWAAVPEPASALAGLLLGAGIIRRRRPLASQQRWIRWFSTQVHRETGS